MCVCMRAPARGRICPQTSRMTRWKARGTLVLCLSRRKLRPGQKLLMTLSVQGSDNILRDWKVKIQGQGAYQPESGVSQDVAAADPHPSLLMDSSPAPLWEGSCSVVQSCLSIGSWAWENARDYANPSTPRCHKGTVTSGLAAFHRVPSSRSEE